MTYVGLQGMGLDAEKWNHPFRVAFCYRSGRLNGLVCENEHTYRMAETRDGVGVYVGDKCSHTETDGYVLPFGDFASECWEEQLNFEQHDSNHLTVVDGCSYCEFPPDKEN